MNVNVVIDDWLLLWWGEACSFIYILSFLILYIHRVFRFILRFFTVSPLSSSSVSSPFTTNIFFLLLRFPVSPSLSLLFLFILRFLLFLFFFLSFYVSFPFSLVLQSDFASWILFFLISLFLFFPFYLSTVGCKFTLRLTHLFQPNLTTPNTASPYQISATFTLNYLT